MTSCFLVSSSAWRRSIFFCRRLFLDRKLMFCELFRSILDQLWPEAIKIVFDAQLNFLSRSGATRMLIVLTSWGSWRSRYSTRSCSGVALYWSESWQTAVFFGLRATASVLCRNISKKVRWMALRGTWIVIWKFLNVLSTIATQEV